jgi:hypothetical protein
MYDFDPNDRAAIEAALQDADPHNPIAVAFAEKLTDLGKRFAKHAEKLGRVPTELLIAKPRTAFDDMALRIFLQEVADATGVSLKVVWASSDSDA